MLQIKGSVPHILLMPAASACPQVIHNSVQFSCKLAVPMTSPFGFSNFARSTRNSGKHFCVVQEGTEEHADGDPQVRATVPSPRAPLAPKPHALDPPFWSGVEASLMKS